VIGHRVRRVESGGYHENRPDSTDLYAFVGVDIAATTAAVATQRSGARASRSCTIDQTPEGYTKLGHQLQATGMWPSRILVVMEATGSYWISLATYLVHEGFVVSVINPAQAHHFAKAPLKRTKTDAIDARRWTS